MQPTPSDELFQEGSVKSARPSSAKHGTRKQNPDPHAPMIFSAQPSLFGEPLPPTVHELGQLFVAAVFASPTGLAFNDWRWRMGIQQIPAWTGTYIRAAAERAGLAMHGTSRATAPRSRSRITVVWVVPEGARPSSSAPAAQAVAI
ncbi:MAG: hypothetical protein HY291_02145 [Planctomycetes bacterium]|nr:hypothetical protein [Planctomycetota bacterium]